MYVRSRKRALELGRVHYLGKKCEKHGTHKRFARNGRCTQCDIEQAAKRRNAIKDRTPRWMSENDLKHIESLHFVRKSLAEVTGLTYNLDHVIPLQGDTVSGLHVPANLAIVEKLSNLSKGNRFNIE